MVVLRHMGMWKMHLFNCVHVCVWWWCVCVCEWNMPEGVYEHTDTNDIPELLNQVW